MVLAAVHPFIEQTHRGEDLTADHDRRHPDGAELETMGKDVPMPGDMPVFLIEMLSPSQPPFPGVTDQVFRKTLHRFRLTFQFLRPPVIIGVEKGDHPAPGLPYPEIPRCGRPPVRREPEPADGRGTAPIETGLDSLPAAIGRGVVDYDNLLAPHRLAAHRAQGSHQHVLAVVGRDDDRDWENQRLHG